MTRLAVLLTEGFADWECAFLMASGRTYFGFEIVVATPGGSKVTSSGGLRVEADQAFEDLDAQSFDGLAISGGAIWQSGQAPDIADVTGAFLKEGKLVGAICDAVFALAETGVLDTVAHTGNQRAQLVGQAGYGGADRYIETAKAWRDGRIVTAAGTAPVSFMAEMLRGLGYGGEALDPYLDMLAAEHAA